VVLELSLSRQLQFAVRYLFVDLWVASDHFIIFFIDSGYVRRKMLI